MKRYDRICSIFCLVFAAIVMWQSTVIPMGRVSKPGPGFLPFWVAVILALLSFLLWMETSLRKVPSDRVKFLAGEGRWPSVMMTVGTLLIYAFVIETLGFIISTLILLFFLFRFVGNQKWWLVFTETALVTLMTHLIFKVGLKVQLPAGLFRI